MIHVIESVSAVFFCFAAVLAAYPHRGRVAVREAEILALFEHTDGLCLRDHILILC